MKKIKTLLLLTLTFLTTGCFKQDDFEDINIYTTIYPVEYIVEYLYGEYSEISSIYPNGVDVNSYELTNKQIKDYSKMNLYVFNGNNDKESDYVTSIFKYNKNLKIIDATNTMEYNDNELELWLDPSNFLMMALNIKNGILEYTTNHYLNEKIEDNYNKLKIEISKIDANLKLMYENATNKTIVVDNNALKFLSKYGFNVISLADTDITDKTILEVKNLIKIKKIDYIFTFNEESLSNTAKSIKEETNVNIKELYTIDNLTDEMRKNKETYITILNENIDMLKDELYN